MTTKIDIQTDVGINGTSDLQKVKNDMTSTADSANRARLEMREFRQQLKQAAADAKEMKRQLKGIDFGAALKMVSMGSPNAAMSNALTKGSIADINSNAMTQSARQLIASFNALDVQVKARERSERIERAKMYRPGSDFSGMSSAQLKQVLNDARLAQSIVGSEARKNASGGLDQRTAAFANYNQIGKDIDRIRSTIPQVVEAERQIAIEAKKTQMAKAKTVDYQSRIAQKDAEISIRASQASKVEMLQLQMQRQKLVISEALQRSQQQVTAEVQKQMAVQSQLRNQMRAAQKEAAITSQREARSNLMSDNGASLFKVQAGLTLNFMLMNQFFKLFSFGRQYVVELDKTFRDLQAIIEATDTGMEKLKQTIIEVSQETRFSAVEVAKAATVMGQAGMSLDQIDKSIGAVTKLATATGTDLTKSVEVATSVLSVFNLQAEEMTHVANVLTGALNLSKLDIDKIALGIQYAGNVAADSGASFEELVAALGAISNAGIKSGSTMGTGLRQLLTEFLDPSEKFLKVLNDMGISVAEVDVRSQGLTQVFRNLSEAGFTTGEAFKAMDIRAAAAYAALTKNLDLADRMEESFILTNAAAAANEVQMKSFSNTVDRFTNVLGVAINTGLEPLIKSLRELMEGLANGLQALNEWPVVVGGITLALTTLVGVVAANHFGGLITSLLFGKETKSFGDGLKKLGAIKTALVGLVTGVSGLSTLVAALGGPFTVLLGVLAAGAFAWGTWSAKGTEAARTMDRLRENFSAAEGDFQSTQGRIESVEAAIGRVIDRYDALNSSASATRAEALRLQVQFGEMGIAIDHNTTSVDGLVNSLRNLRNSLKDVSVEQAKSMAQAKAYVLAEQMASNIRAGKDREGVGQYTLSYLYRTGYAGASRIGAADAAGGNIESRVSELSRQAINASSTPQALAEFQMKWRELLSEADGQLNFFNSELTAVTNKLKQGDLSSRERRSFEAAKGVLEKMLTEAMAQRQRITNTASMSGELSMIVERTVPEAVSAATDTAKAMTDYVADTTKRITQIQTMLRTRRDEDDQPLSKEKLAELSAERDALKAEMASMSVKSVLQYLKKNYQSWFESGDDSKIVEEIKASIDTTKAKAVGAVTDADNAVGKVVEQLNQAYESLLKRHAEVMEKAGESARQAAERLGVRAAAYGYVESESGVGGGLYGKYSAGERLVFANRQRELEIQRMEKERDSLGEKLAVMRSQLGERQGRASIMLTQAGLDPNDATSETAVSIRKGLAEATKQLADAENQYADAVNKVRAARGQDPVGIDTKAGTFEQISTSVKTWAQENELAMSGLDKNIKELTYGTLTSAKTEFASMFRSIADGTKGVGEAFKGMAAGITSTMLDMVTQLLSKQILGNLFGALGSAFDFDVSDLLGKANGGPVRAAAGRAIPQRDSVHALLRPGEFVMRNSAVDAIGVENLAAMNAYGNRKIQSSQAAMSEGMSLGDAKQVVTNVWVVSKEEQAQMGPKDVLAVVHKDITQGGTTKKLIKQVVQ